MPKIIELTVEIEVQRVSCPGVWLCQDGRVSLTVFALGTSYQTCLLPPVFPLTFRDVFYFRKRFQESCALNNICCLLKDETIYCELVQWCQDCATSECVTLAQYLGSLNEVLFPPNMCSNDGVDLLMRRSKEFPGILAPKVEITTKVRIDEVWDAPPGVGGGAPRPRPCRCAGADGSRQKPVCHSAQYHRKKCHGSPKRPPSISKSRSRSRSRSGGSRSGGSCGEPRGEPRAQCCCPNPITKSGVRMRMTSPRKSRRPCRRDYCVYNMEMPTVDHTWREATDPQDYDNELKGTSEYEDSTLANEDRIQKLILESRYIDEECHETHEKRQEDKKLKTKKYDKINIKPCVCEICKRYHELFHDDYTKTC